MQYLDTAGDSKYICTFSRRLEVMSNYFIFEIKERNCSVLAEDYNYFGLIFRTYVIL